MELQKRIGQGLPPEDAEDMDFLLEFAGLLRDHISERRFDAAAGLVRYAVGNRCLEAFGWAMGILEECYGEAGNKLPDLECALGRYIPDYDGFIARLGADLNAAENDVLPVRDENGEIQSFYNIISYPTGFSRIRLVTSENFDTRDNDFIEYTLICSSDRNV